ncbi:MAG: hypothetical protein K2F87_01240 [Muribaculaceae bacterium]|nr:hypothetical protein [Muribaculaceae bacterium]
MKTKEIIKGVLEKWGFPVQDETEQSVVFRYQMNYVQANEASREDAPAVTLTLSGFFSADNEQERLMGLKVCNLVSYRMLQVKAYIDDDSDAVIASEFFYRTPEDMEFLLEEGLNMMIGAKRAFRDKYRELERESRGLSGPGQN